MPQLLYPGKEHRLGGCVDPRVGLDILEKRKIFCNTTLFDTSAETPVELKMTC
jgi:hypothetical protein